MIGVARRETQILLSSILFWQRARLQTNHSSAYTTRTTDFQSCSNSESSALSVDAETSTAAAFYAGLTRKQVIEMSYDD